MMVLARLLPGNLVDYYTLARTYYADEAGNSLFEVNLTTSCDRSADIAPPGLVRRRFSDQPRPTPTKPKPDLKEAKQDSQIVVIYRAKPASLVAS